MELSIESENNEKDDVQNSRVQAAVYLSCIAGFCTLLVLVLVSSILLVTIRYLVLNMFLISTKIIS